MTTRSAGRVPRPQEATSWRNGCPDSPTATGTSTADAVTDVISLEMANTANATVAPADVRASDLGQGPGGPPAGARLITTVLVPSNPGGLNGLALALGWRAAPTG